MLGLEYSPTELITSLKQSRKAGILDVLLNALPGATCALILGWGPMAAVALAGITWVSSSGVTAKVLRDLRRLGNRDTPTILSILVIEDLARAFYLPVLPALVIGAGVLAGATALVVALLVVAVILYLALRHGRVVSRLFAADHSESLVGARCSRAHHARGRHRGGVASGSDPRRGHDRNRDLHRLPRRGGRGNRCARPVAHRIRADSAR